MPAYDELLLLSPLDEKDAVTPLEEGEGDLVLEGDGVDALLATGEVDRIVFGSFPGRGAQERPLATPVLFMADGWQAIVSFPVADPSMSFRNSATHSLVTLYIISRSP